MGPGKPDPSGSQEEPGLGCRRREENHHRRHPKLVKLVVDQIHAPDRKRGPARSGSIIIGALTMFSEVEPFTLGFFAGTQAHCLVDDEKEDGRTDSGPR